MFFILMTTPFYKALMFDADHFQGLKGYAGAVGREDLMSYILQPEYFLPSQRIPVLTPT